MKQNTQQLINNIKNNMTVQEIELEISALDNAYIGLSKKDFLANSSELTEEHYEQYLNRMESNRNRRDLLLEALNELTTELSIMGRYGVSYEVARFGNKFFNSK